MNWYALLFGGFAAAIVLALVSFEVLIWRLYEYHQYDWLVAGSPPPFFMSLFDQWRGHLAKRRLTWAWLFRTPKWILRDTPSRLILYVHRVSVVVILVGPPSFVIVILLLS